MLVSDAFAEALARIVAEKQKEFDQTLALLQAECRASLAQTQNAVRDALDKLADKMALVKDGRDGKDGVSGPAGPRGEQGEQGLQGERGESGFDGERGLPGEKGTQGEQGPRGERGEPGPAGEQGPRGLPGVPGDRGEKGESGRDGMPGRDGLHGLQGERGPSGKDGRDGIDGKDGAGFDEWQLDYDGERKITFRCGSGERTKQFTIALPIPIHRGLFKPGTTYQRGDEVKFGGHIYRALKETTTKPSESEEWTLAAHRGRDGRDGKDGAQGVQGPEGRPGRDLTQLGPDGSKW